MKELVPFKKKSLSKALPLEGGLHGRRQIKRTEGALLKRSIPHSEWFVLHAYKTSTPGFAYSPQMA